MGADLYTYNVQSHYSFVLGKENKVFTDQAQFQCPNTSCPQLDHFCWLSTFCQIDFYTIPPALTLIAESLG